ncbi:MAG: type II toxin-antitoxin system RelE/ParE family toxin [Deltaproteobacteria bacterium]|nr:type II toxin-antitoxin system RelE/ParE family toxin [Deltaproteobacteria bacterium]
MPTTVVTSSASNVDGDVRDHLEPVDRKFFSLIRETIEEQLSFEPDIETTNRKPMRQPNLLDGEWELRFGPDNRFRVFYRIDSEAREVLILAIGVKKGSVLHIGRSRFEL